MKSKNILMKVASSLLAVAIVAYSTPCILFFGEPKIPEKLR
jgi:hypothetical protein